MDPDRFSNAAVIAAYDRASCWQHACGLVAQWDKASHKRDSVMYNAAIGACATCEQWQQSLALLLGRTETRSEGATATHFQQNCYHPKYD